MFDLLAGAPLLNTPLRRILLIKLKFRGYGGFIDDAGAEGCLRSTFEVSHSRTAALCLAICTEHYLTDTHSVLLGVIDIVEMINEVILYMKGIFLDREASVLMH